MITAFYRILAASLVWVSPAFAYAQFGVAPRFSLSDTIRVDEADAQTLAQFTRIDELFAAGQNDDGLEALGRVMREHDRKLVRIEPRRFVTVREYAHATLAALGPDALAAYRRRVDARAESLYRRGVAERDERRLGEVADTWFCSSWGDDACVALAELALERGDMQAARRRLLALFESPSTAIPSAAFDAVRGDATLSAADAALLDRYYVKYTPPERLPPIAGDPPAANAPAPNAPPAEGKKPPPAPTAWHVANATEWSKLSDADAAALVRLWKSRRLRATRLAYPGTDRPLADLRARLILADLLDGAHELATEKLESFKRLHPRERGTLAGQEGVLAERLAAIALTARTWPRDVEPNRSARLWPTFAGGLKRTGAAHESFKLPFVAKTPAWRVSLGKPQAASVETDRQVLERQPRIGESWDRPMSYFPIVVGSRIFVAYADGIAAIDMATGRPAWPTATAEGNLKEQPTRTADAEPTPAKEALIYRDEAFAPLKTNQWVRGVPRFSLTVQGDWLLARVGPPATSRPTESRLAPAASSSKLVVLDISTAGQGRLVCDPIEPDDEQLAFDGAPVSDGRYLYAVLRRSDVRPEVLVACYDAQINPPRMRWRTSVAAAETPGSGQLFECTHNLLSLAGDTLYLNTNLGAVAALSADDGRIRWLNAYPRVRLGDLRRLADTGHFYRDLTPCLLHDDVAIVAPFDAPAIFALDAASGMLRWTTDAAPDAIHLLGVANGVLWASGDFLYAFDVRTGQLLTKWPQAVRAEPRGIGRGLVLADNKGDAVVLWPTRDELHIFDAGDVRQTKKITPRQPPILWSRQGVYGGNLIWVDGRLIVASDSQVVAFGP